MDNDKREVNPDELAQLSGGRGLDSGRLSQMKNAERNGKE